MKYILMKDGRIVSIDETKEIIPSLRLAKEQGEIVVYHGIEVVKIADTIEELLDKIIAVNQFNPQEHFTLAYKPKQPSNGMNVYGCIWTTGAYGEPILKAVTKPMNNKGEFELL